MQLDMQGLENQVSNFEPFRQVLPVLAIACTAPPVRKEVQLVEEAVTMNYTQILSSSPTLDTYSNDPNCREHMYVISPVSPPAAIETATVGNVPPPDCTTVENFTLRSADVVESPMPSTSENSVLHMNHARITPINTYTNLIDNSRSIRAPHAETSPRMAMSASSSTSTRASPLVSTSVGHIHNDDDTNRVAEHSRASMNFATPTTRRVGQKRPIVVPPMDAFARKKKKEAGKSDATEDAIIGCTQDLREMSSEFEDLLKMKKELIRAQLEEGRGKAETPKTSQMIDSGDGFLNLLQEEWLELPIEIQDELFSGILDIMEEFEVE